MVDFKQLKQIMDGLFVSHNNGRYDLHPDKESVSDFKMCRYSALLSSLIMNSLADSEWEIRGGSVWYPYFAKGGFFDGDEWHGHYWITNGIQIVDMAARQFGVHEGYIVTSADDSRYLENFDEDEIVEHMKNVEVTVNRWFRGLKNDGLLDRIKIRPQREPRL